MKEIYSFTVELEKEVEKKVVPWNLKNLHKVEASYLDEKAEKEPS